MRSITGFNSDSANGAFAPGQPIYASTLNSMATCADKSRTMPSNDLVFNAGVGGTAYSLGQSVYYSPTANPLDPNLSDDKVSIVIGTVNRYIPKIGTHYIDEVPAPQLTVNDSGYVMVKATYEVNKFFPRNAEIVFQAVPTPPVDTDTESYYPLGKVTKTTVGETSTYSMQIFQNGNLIVNRLKAGASTATWWWTVIP